MKKKKNIALGVSPAKCRKVDFILGLSRILNIILLVIPYNYHLVFVKIHVNLVNNDHK